LHELLEGQKRNHLSALIERPLAWPQSITATNPFKRVGFYPGTVDLHQMIEQEADMCVRQWRRETEARR